MNLALFDFDGTITTRGTYLDFIHFAVSRTRKVVGTAALTPWVVGYRMGLSSFRSVSDRWSPSRRRCSDHHAP